MSDPNIVERRLECLRLQAHHHITRQMLRTEGGSQEVLIARQLEVERRLEDWTDSIVHEIVGRFWGDKHPDVTFTFPGTCWQYFKLRYFRPWMLKRWPVMYTTEKFRFWTLYPAFIPAKGIGDTVVFPEQVTHTRIWRDLSKNE